MTKLMLEARLMAFLDKIPEDADIEAVILVALFADNRFVQCYEGMTDAILQSVAEFVTKFADDDNMPHEPVRELFSKALSDEYWPND